VLVQQNNELIIEYPGVIQLVFMKALSRFRIKQWFRLVFLQARSITKIFCSVHLNQRSNIRKGVNGLWAKMVWPKKLKVDPKKANAPNEDTKWRTWVFED
jgi:hypothetical protein